MSPTDTATVIAILNANIALEHSAIVQYLLHAYAMGEGGVGAAPATVGSLMGQRQT
jgi:bacterioferritin (cytochrome b1)